MGTLNPNLITTELTDLLADAVTLAKRYRRRNLYPELVLLVMLQQRDNDARSILEDIAQQRGADLDKLERQVRLAMETRDEVNGGLEFLMPNGYKFPLSRQMLVALDEALTIAQTNDESAVHTDHLLAAMTHQRLQTSILLQQQGITEALMLELFGAAGAQGGSGQHPMAKDWVEAARQGDLRAVYFREPLLREMINMLGQAVRRHIILVGPDGVGKRTLAYSLALLMTEGQGPPGLDKFVQADERALLDNSVETIQSAIMRARGGILFVPHIQRFFGGPGKADFPQAGQNLLKVFLGDDPVLISTTSSTNLDARLSKISTITEHAQILRVPEPSPDETLEILSIVSPHIAAEYDIDINEQALSTAVDLARRYIGEMPLPRSVEHLLHRTAAMVSLSQQKQLAFKPVLKNSTLDIEDVTLAAAQMTGIPVSKLDQDERSRYARMVEHLHERIIGQEDAVLAVSRAVKTARVGLKDPRRPIGSFLFLGPSGVGKTELARALAAFMFGDEEALLQIDMSEYMDENAVSRLIGAPPGYVGYEGGGQLTDRVREQPYIVVLFDEVEKAHPRIVDILLQVLEEGRLTDAQGNVASFSEAVVIMTSNLGADYLQQAMLDDEIKAQVMAEVRRHFRPEFLNRLDDIIIFHPLNRSHLRDILDLLLADEQRLGARNGLHVEFTDAAAEWLLAQNKSLEYGARPLRRIIQRTVRNQLADFLLRDGLPAKSQVVVDANREGLYFEVK